MALTDNLISYWKLDEASGDAADAHGSNTLTDVNTVGTGTGKINGARDFEADNSEAFTKADNADLSTGDIDFTVQAWVNLETDPAGTMYIVAKWQGTVNEYRLFYTGGATDRFRWTVTGSGGNVTVTADNFGAASVSTWYLVHAWHDAVNNQIGIAVNAGTANTQAHSAGVNDSDGTFALGRLGGSASGFWDGLIDEAALWKRVLTSQERTDLYNGGSGLSYDNFGGATGQPAQRRLGGVAGGRPVEIGREGVLVYRRLPSWLENHVSVCGERRRRRG